MTLNCWGLFHRECLVRVLLRQCRCALKRRFGRTSLHSLRNSEEQGEVTQLCAGCIGRAANDLTLVFRKSAHELSSAFTVWALRLTERCVSVLVADVLLPFAVPMGLSATMECVLQIMVYCSCLEDTHRVCLQPHLLRVLWPQIDNVISLHIARYVPPS